MWLFKLFRSHRIKKIYITEIYIEKQWKSSIIKNHKITKKKKMMVFPQKAMQPPKLYLDFAPEIKKMHCA